MNTNSQRIECGVAALTASACGSANQYLQSALQAIEDLPKDIDRTAVLVAHINAASAQEAAAMNLIGQQHNADALMEISTRLEALADAVEYARRRATA